MCTNGVWQLEKLTMRYCRYGGSSLNARNFIKYGYLSKFATQNPQLQVYTDLKPNHHPVLIGRYINDVEKVIDIKNKSVGEIFKFCDTLRNSSGRKMTRLDMGKVKTKQESIQGTWTHDVTKDVPFKVKTIKEEI